MRFARLDFNVAAPQGLCKIAGLGEREAKE